MNELFGDSPEVQAKEELFSEFFGKVATQDFGRGDEQILVKENYYACAPEVTKAIAVRRLLTNDALQRDIFNILGKKETLKDTEERYLIIKGENNEFVKISIISYTKGGKTYYERAQEDQEIKGDSTILTNIAKEIKDQLSSEVKRIEK